MKTATLAFVAALFAASACAAYAATDNNKPSESNSDDSSQELAEYQITAMRFGDSIYSVPSNAQNISSEKISESALGSVPEILRRYADVFFRTSGSNANNGEISMRGFGENSNQRVLILVDGQRLNRLDMLSQNWRQIPLDEIENIEVLRGPQSALYGNYAVGGVIKISTKKWNQPDSVNFGGDYGSFGEYSAWGKLFHSQDDYYVGADANYNHIGGYQDFSENWAKSAGVNAGVKLDSQNELTFAANVGDEYISWANPALSYSQMKDNPTYSSGVSSTNDINYATFSTGWENESSHGEGSAQLGANLRDKQIDYPSTPLYSNRGKLWTMSFTPRYRVLFGSDEESHIEGGVDFYYDDFSIEALAKTYSSDVDRATVAPWLGGKIALDDTFSISASGRYEAAMDNAECTGWSPYTDDDFVNGLAAQIGINARLAETANVYARFDQIYRYPSVDERFSVWNWGPTYINRSLKPERGQNYELGANFSKDGFSARGSAFYMHLDDEISYNPYTYATQNIGNTNRYGAEVKLAYEVEPVGISTSWTFVSARFYGGSFDGNRVPLVPQIVSSTVAWVKPVDFCRIEFAYQWADGQYMGSDYKNASPEMPAVWSIDITANFFITKNLRAFAAVNNATDETYALAAYDYGYSQSWYVAPGRAFRVGLEVKF